MNILKNPPASRNIVACSLGLNGKRRDQEIADHKTKEKAIRHINQKMPVVRPTKKLT